jgi:hypothetical protein
MLGDVKYAFDKGHGGQSLERATSAAGRVPTMLFAKVPTGSGGLAIITLATQSVALKNNSGLI